MLEHDGMVGGGGSTCVLDSDSSIVVFLKMTWRIRQPRKCGRTGSERMSVWQYLRTGGGGWFEAYDAMSCKSCADAFDDLCAILDADVCLYPDDASSPRLSAPYLVGCRQTLPRQRHPARRAAAQLGLGRVICPATGVLRTIAEQFSLDVCHEIIYGDILA